MPTDNPHASVTAPPEFAHVVPGVDLSETLKTLLAGETLGVEATGRAFEAMMTGQVHQAEMAALLALLATRTPTSDEILGAAEVMRRHVDPVRCRRAAGDIVDTAGTGGAPKTFNVSTAAALVAAAAGAIVAKHGNRSRTGRGSAEVLERLGVDIDADRRVQARCLDEAGVCFCFAIHHHPATRHVMPVRKALGFPTIFNLLGPLTNPAGARRQVMGVYDRRFVRPIAETLVALGSSHAMVVHSEDGLDELSISAPTLVAHVEDGVVREAIVEPETLGLRLTPLEALKARDLDHATRLIAAILRGEERGPPRDMTLLNSAAALMVAGLAASWRGGIEQAAPAIDDGAAAERLEQLVVLSKGEGTEGLRD